MTVPDFRTIVEDFLAVRGDADDGDRRDFDVAIGQAAFDGGAPAVTETVRERLLAEDDDWGPWLLVDDDLLRVFVAFELVGHLGRVLDAFTQYVSGAALRAAMRETVTQFARMDPRHEIAQAVAWFWATRVGRARHDAGDR